ncbi:ATP-binding protein [Streptomyces sp. NPDC127098]|uniref:ATP-binding protein n=1 Tax=Streptomyces sp. NPDC127098 TaxID=3347137 RepID=UPI0036604E02
MSRFRVWVVTCRGIPQEITRARKFVREIFEGEPWADDAALIVTELGTNALAHTTGGGFRLTLTRSPEGITIAVTDSGGTTTRPHVQDPTTDNTGGRGLALVHAYADTVTIHGDHRGHTVTAELHPNSTAPETC